MYNTKNSHILETAGHNFYIQRKNIYKMYKKIQFVQKKKNSNKSAH